MKKSYFLAVAVLALCLALPITADFQTEEADASAGPVYSDDGKILESFPQGSGTVCKVKDGTQAIGEHAFSGNQEVQFVEMPESVVEIGAGAFLGCISLVEPGLPDSVRTIGEQAFDGTPIRLEKLPESLETIGTGAFSDCRHITSLELPDKVRSVGDFAFAYSGITHLVLNDGLREIGDSAFGGVECGFLEVPASVEKVGEMFVYINAVKFNGNPEGLETSLFESFYTGCDPVIKDATHTPGFAIEGGLVYAVTDGNASVVSYIPDEVGTNSVARQVTIDGISYDVTAIAPDSFASSPFEYLHAQEDMDRGAVPESKLQRSLSIPDSVRTIGTGAFGESSLKEVTIPESVKLIADSAFVFCMELTSADIGAKVVGQMAFTNCESLENLKIRGSVDAVGRYAFRMCPLPEIQLTDAEYGEKVFDDVPFHILRIGEGVKDLSMLDLVNADGVDRITLDPLNRNFTLKDGVLFSADGKELILYSSEAGNSYTVPEGTESIGYCAFFRADATEVSLPESLRSIGDMAFVGSAVDRITVPSGVTEIEGAPFYLMTIKAECDPELIDWNQNFPADETISDGTFVYTQREGFALVTGLAQMHPSDIVVPSKLLCDGTMLPVKLGCFSLSGISLDRLSFSGKVEIEEGVLLDSTVKKIVVSSWMDAGFIDLLVSGCNVSGYGNDSTDYQIKDGAVFSGSTLVRFPTSVEGGYTVPEGTVSIEDRAFADSSLRGITVPASVEKAGNRAFTGMHGVLIQIIGSDTELSDILDSRDDPADYRFVSPEFMEDLAEYPQGHMIRYTSMDAPEGFELPEDSFVPYGDEAVPEIPVVEGYVTYALIEGEEWQPDTYYMGISDIELCFVFEYDPTYSEGGSLLFMAIPLVLLSVLVVAFLVFSGRRKA